MNILLRYILFFVLAGISTVVYAQYYLPINRIGLEIGGGLSGLLNRNMPNNSNLQLVGFHFPVKNGILDQCTLLVVNRTDNKAIVKLAL